jgi:hypothetical protein
VQYEIWVSSQLSLAARTTTKILDSFGWSRHIPNAYRLLASSPTFKYAIHNGSPCMCSWLTLNMYSFV